MKKFKGLLAIAFAFALFAVCGGVYAEGLVCNNEVCDITITEVREGDEILVNPELLTLDEYEKAFLVSVNPHTEISNMFNMKFGYDDDGIYGADIFHGFAPIVLFGGLNEKKDDDLYYVNYAPGALEMNLGEYNPIGYLIVNDEFDLSNFSYSFYSSEYSRYSGTDLTLNGIKYNSEADYISTDIFFGDFRYDYVIDSNEESYEEYWKPVNKNSNKIIIDNTKSLLSLYGNLVWDNSNSYNIKLSVYDELLSTTPGLGIGDSVPQILNDGGNYTFIVGLSDKVGITVDPKGGSEAIAKEILNTGGNIGYISLYLSAEREF